MREMKVNLTKNGDMMTCRLHDKDRPIQWPMEDGLLGKSQVCSVWGDDIKLDDRSDGFKWECRRRTDS